jgi:hypothetical protein
MTLRDTYDREPLIGNQVGSALRVFYLRFLNRVR